MDPLSVDATDAKKAADALVKHVTAPQRLLVLRGASRNDADLRIQRATTQGLLPERALSRGLVVATSGSTGRPNLVCLENDALKSSADATHSYLGGPGRWVTVLPLTHIAGIQTVIRSTYAGQPPFLAHFRHFRPDTFGSAAEEARAQTPSSVPLYCSLVTAQLAVLLDENPNSLRHFDAILVGGGFVSETLIRAAASLGVRVVTTYGMTETSGGCVYDGRPLPGTRVLADEDGRLLISGPTLMAGYLDEKAPWVHRENTRWFATSDQGGVLSDGTVQVTGRNDDLIKSGGVKINLTAVAQACRVDGVREAHGFPVPDERWGNAVGVLVETALDPQEVGPRVADAVRAKLGGPSTPRYVATTTAMPTTALGKIDRKGARLIGMNQIGQGDAWHR